MYRTYFVSLVLVIILIIAAVGVVMWLDNASCAAKTEYIGFDSRWSVLGGCQIEVETGQWIPLESYYFKQE